MGIIIHELQIPLTVLLLALVNSIHLNISHLYSL